MTPVLPPMRIHLTKQGGRVVDIPHSALVDAGGESDHIRRHASSDGIYYRVAVGSRGEQPAADFEYALHRLVFLVRGDGKRGPALGEAERELRYIAVVDYIDIAVHIALPARCAAV